MGENTLTIGADCGPR